MRTGFSPAHWVTLTSVGAGLGPRCTAQWPHLGDADTPESEAPGQGSRSSEAGGEAGGCGGLRRLGLGLHNEAGAEPVLRPGRPLHHPPQPALWLGAGMRPLRFSPPLGKPQVGVSLDQSRSCWPSLLPQPGGSSFSVFPDLPPGQAPGPPVYPEPGPVVSGAWVSGRLCQSHACLGF